MFKNIIKKYINISLYSISYLYIYIMIFNDNIKHHYDKIHAKNASILIKNIIK